MPGLIITLIEILVLCAILACFVEIFVRLLGLGPEIRRYGLIIVALIGLLWLLGAVLGVAPAWHGPFLGRR